MQLIIQIYMVLTRILTSVKESLNRDCSKTYTQQIVLKAQIMHKNQLAWQ